MDEQYVYVIIYHPRGSYKTGTVGSYLGYKTYTSFEKAKKEAFKGFNGTIEILSTNEDSIDVIGLQFAYYEMKLTNINGEIHYFFIEIQKKEVKS